jgi:transketolase
MRQAALQKVFELAKKNPRILFIGSDLGSGTLSEMKSELPMQFIMEGISEQYLVGFVAGLAKEGFIPYVNTIANFFTRRAFEQLAMDVALHNLPVRFLASGGGMVYAPLGPTHTAVEDLAMISCIPKFRIFAPGDEYEMQNIIQESVTDLCPWYIRFGKGDEPNFSSSIQTFPTKPKVFGDDEPDYLILVTGIMVHEALQAMKFIQNTKESRATVVHFPELTNLDVSAWKPYFESSKKVLVAEEHFPQGGLFSKILHLAWEEGMDTKKIMQQSLPFMYSHKYGNQRDHLQHNGLDAQGLVKALTSKGVESGN